MDNFHGASLATPAHATAIHSKQQALMAKSSAMTRPMNTKEVQTMLEKNDFALRSWMVLQKHEPSPANTKEVKAWFSKCSMIRQQIAARLEVLASLADSQIAREENQSSQLSSPGPATTLNTSKREPMTNSRTSSLAQMPSNRPPVQVASSNQMMTRMATPVASSTTSITVSQSATTSMALPNSACTTVGVPSPSPIVTYPTNTPNKTLTSSYPPTDPSVGSSSAPGIASLPPPPFMGNDFEDTSFNPANPNQSFAPVSATNFPDPVPFYNATNVAAGPTSSFEPTPFVNTATSGYSMPMIAPMNNYSMTMAPTNSNAASVAPNTTTSVSQPIYAPTPAPAYGMPYQQAPFNQASMQLPTASQPFVPNSCSMMMATTNSANNPNQSLSMVNSTGSSSSYGYNTFGTGAAGVSGMPMTSSQQAYVPQTIYGNVSGPMRSSMAVTSQASSTGPVNASYQSMSTDSLIEEFFS